MNIFNDSPVVVSGFQRVGTGLIVWLMVSFIGSGSGCAGANKADYVINADRQFEFARQLLSNQDYANAISEFQRFIHFFPEDSRMDEALYALGMAYMGSEQYPEAITRFETLIGRHRQLPEVPDNPVIGSFFRISECYHKMAAVGQAIQTLINLYTLSDQSEIQDRACYQIGWLFLESGHGIQARQWLKKISPANQATYKLNPLIHQIDQMQNLPEKQPMVAGVMGILPGAGYLYTHRYRDALVAFLVNGALAYAAWEAFDNGLEGLGGVIGFVGLGFYTGSIYGSVAAVHKYNRNQKDRYIRNMAQQLRIYFSTRRDGNGIGVMFCYRF